MRSSAVAMGLAAWWTVPGAAFAFNAPTHLDRGNVLESASGLETRTERSTRWTPPAEAEARWARFLEAEGGAWRALWDADTKVPLRILGEGVAAPGASLSADAAEAAARAFIGRHLELLAPGAASGDLALVANVFDAQSNLRTVAFEQRHRGVAVLGGQLSVRIKRDRIFVVGSEALPNVDAAAPKAVVRADKARSLALAWIDTIADELSVLEGPKGAFILPLISADRAIEYPTVVEVVVDAIHPRGRWSVYLDAATGAPVARRQTLRFLSATAHFNAPVRHPGSTRHDVPAPFVSATVGGQAVTADAQGVLTWTGADPASIQLQATGAEVSVVSDAGAEAVFTGNVGDGAVVVWDQRGEEFVDAQIATYIAGNEVKGYAKEIAPDMAWLRNARLQATVNINDTCNAFSDGTTINFFRASRQCENTGRLTDVVHHEFGHSFHAHAIVRGAGAFDNALSEGASDYLAATMTDDNGMGRGFFYSNAPLRDVDEARDRVWPDDSNDEPHQVGLIFAGAMWDLRKNLIRDFGDRDQAVRYTDQLWYQALKTSADIPSSYAEVLAADDDDGNLANGTPNTCAINEAFARHGLADVTQIGPPISAPVLTNRELLVPVGAAPSECPGVSITGMTLFWQVRGDANTRGTILLSANAAGYAAELPEQAPGTVVQYRVEVALDDSSTLQLPDNAADPYYEVFIGEVVPLYCTDFEVDPAGEGWVHELLAGQNREGADDWTWGEPMAATSSGDPRAAYSGDYVIGNDLGGGNYNGLYQSDKQNAMHAPAVDTQRYPVVRLQYRRWLNVEDGDFDQASIASNGSVVWTNRATGGQGSTHHADKEWRFHDVDLTSSIQDGKVQVSFILTSDGGLEFGGWTLDDFCIVGYLPPGQNICGNGNIEGAEVCDDGNLLDGDGCEATCVFTPGVVACGNGVVDPGEVCDDGNLAGADGCEADCTSTPSTNPDPTCATDPSLCPATDPGIQTLNDGEGGCGCSSAAEEGGAPVSLAWLALAGLLFVRRRR
jgi:MYXO-CTERM domain-containing protein